MNARAPMRVLSFFVAGRAMALPASEVTAVLARPAITPAPRCPAALVGIANLRGLPTPVISLAAAMGGAITEEPHIILLHAADPAALAVSAVGGLRDGEVRDGVVTAGDESFALLDLDRLLARARLPVSPRRADRTPTRRLMAEVLPTRSYLSFRVGAERYALPLHLISAVTTAVAGDEGLVSPLDYRGGALPLVDLRSLLGLAPSATAGQVVIARLAQAEVGLRVDRLGTVLRASEERIGAAPSILNRDAAAACISAIVRTEDGLVAVLSPERLLDHATAARAAALSRPPEESLSRTDEADESLVVFRVGDRRQALPVSAVRAVLGRPPATSVAPGVRPDVVGLMNRGARAVPLIDLRLRHRTAVTGVGRVLLVEDGDNVAGLVVDSIDRTVGDLVVERLEPATLLDELGAGLIVRPSAAGVAA